MHPPALGDRGCPLFARNGFERIDFRPDLAAELFGCGVEIDLDLAHPSAGRGFEPPRRVRGRPAACRDQGKRAPVVHVGVVLPGEADTAVQLDIFLGAIGQRIQAGDAGGSCHLTQFGTIGANHGQAMQRVGAGQFQLDIHVRTLVLDRLIPADLLAEGDAPAVPMAS